MIHLHGTMGSLFSSEIAQGSTRHFYLMRHGETDLNAQGVLQGSIEADLNARGRAQATAAADDVIGLGLQRIISSPQHRALQTAQIIAGALDLPIATCDLLRERSWGVYEGRPRLEAVAEGEGVEPLSGLRNRAVRVLDQIAAKADIPTLVVSHSGLIREMISVLNCGYTQRIENCGIISLSVTAKGRGDRIV